MSGVWEERVLISRKICVGLDTEAMVVGKGYWSSHGLGDQLEGIWSVGWLVVVRGFEPFG